MQDAGAARNQRTRNGPSGTPVPTRCKNVSEVNAGG